MLRDVMPVRTGAVTRSGQQIAWQEFGGGVQTVLLLPTWSIVHSDEPGSPSHIEHFVQMGLETTPEVFLATGGDGSNALTPDLAAELAPQVPDAGCGEQAPRGLPRRRTDRGRSVMTNDDQARERIVKTALDYYEGWFDGDASRMTRALHPELVKRTVRGTDSAAENDSADDMISATAAGDGVKQDPGDRRIEVTVDDVHGRIATARVTSAVYVDYLQLVEVGGDWKILNALWAKA